MGKRKYTPYKKGFKKEYTSSYSMKPKSMEKIVKKVLAKEAEIKFKVIPLPAATSGGVFTYITAIGQGNGDSERIGNKIKLYSLQMSGFFQLNGSSSVQHERLRIIVMVDHENQGVLPTIPLMYSTVATFAENKPRDGDTYKYKRFTVLYDKFFVMKAQTYDSALGSYSGMVYEFPKVYIPMKTHVEYRGINNLVASASQGSVFVGLASANNGVTVGVDAVIKFTDM